MNNLLEHVENNIRVRGLIHRGDRILVAVSGGMDSMTLLHSLSTLSHSLQFKLVVGHFNHQLRGRSSDGDERLVRKMATSLELPFYAGRGDVKSHANQSGVSIEMAARELRHNFLANAASEARCNAIATAHHADDQVELFFLRLLRGSGGDGVSGMKWKARSPFNPRLSIIRPLLGLDKTVLSDFAVQNSIAYREDASNRSADFLRNRVRLELLPLLRRRFHVSLDKSVARLMTITGAETELVSALAEKWLAAKSRKTPFANCHVALQRRIIQLQLLRLGVAPEFDLIESLRLGYGKTISISQNAWLVLNHEGIVSQTAAKNHVFNAQTSHVSLDETPKRKTFSGAMFTWKFVPYGKQHRHKKPAPCVESFDADAVGSNIVLRHWKSGDRFQPIGMKSAVKLQDWFVNQKIPAARRREMILATTQHGEVFWVEGLRIGERFKLTETTVRRLNWRWRRQ